VQVGSSPIFLTEKRLGKGGFGQVFLGTRANARRTRGQDPSGNNQVHGGQIAHAKAPVLPRSDGGASLLPGAMRHDAGLPWRASPSAAELSGAAQVAIKLEHKSSKGCAHGHPHEWTVYG
jgi:hypothetical protein